MGQVEATHRSTTRAGSGARTGIGPMAGRDAARQTVVRRQAIPSAGNDGIWGGSASGSANIPASAAAGVAALRDLRAMAVEFPVVHGHPNRLPFEGVLTLLDVPSDKAPSGARGHRVVLTRQAAETALPSLLGMAVDYKAGWDGHDARQKCGIITAAEVVGKKLTVAGYLYARDFPEFGPAMETHIQAEGALGMSYELADAQVADMRAPIWTLTRATFTGAAILLREKAAYRSTSFRVNRAGTTARRAALTR